MPESYQKLHFHTPIKALVFPITFEYQPSFRGRTGRPVCKMSCNAAASPVNFNRNLTIGVKDPGMDIFLSYLHLLWARAMNFQ